MPGGDRTGPMGMGPRTGRGAGYCGGAGVPGFISRIGGAFLGQGRGRGGRGGGRGRRNMFYATGLTGWQRAAMDAPAADISAAATATTEQEVEALKQQAAALAQTLGPIFGGMLLSDKRVAELISTASAVTQPNTPPLP